VSLLSSGVAADLYGLLGPTRSNLQLLEKHVARMGDVLWVYTRSVGSREGFRDLFA
jgi:hypothetical protein